MPRPHREETSEPATAFPAAEVRRARLLILVGLGVASAILVVRLLWPFLPAIVTSAVLAALAFPAHERFARLLRHLLRAIVVGNRAELHPLAVFFSVLGGIVMVGAAGIFVGPVLFVVALALLRMTTLALDGRAGAAEAGTPPSPDDATLSLPLTGQAGSAG